MIYDSRSARAVICAPIYNILSQPLNDPTTVPNATMFIMQKIHVRAFNQANACLALFIIHTGLDLKVATFLPLIIFDVLLLGLVDNLRRKCARMPFVKQFQLVKYISKVKPPK